MMHTSTDTVHSPHIDTLAISKKLQAAGVSKKQAEAQAEVWGDVIAHNLATKTDVENLRLANKTDIENLRKDTLIAMGNNKVEIIKWVAGLLVAQMIGIIGILAGLMKLI